MLILSRKIGEAIMIGDTVRVVITRIEGNAVRVAIQAPETVMILREELYDEIHRQGAPLRALPALPLPPLPEAFD